MLNWWDVQGAIPGTVDQLLLWWTRGIMKKMERKIWSAVPLAVLWSVWKHQNECVFRVVTPNPIEFCELIKIRIALWMKPLLKDFSFSMHDFNFNLRQIRMCLGSWQSN